MTDTAAREEAVERVRALAEGAMQPHEWGYRDPVVGGFVEDRTPFDLADRTFALLDELKVARNFAGSQAEILHHTAELREIAEHRATRAEAHAERLASLMGEMFEDGPVTVGFAGNPIAIADLERRARQALSLYRSETS